MHPVSGEAPGIRWTLAEEEAAHALFDPDRIVARQVGVGAYRGMEFLHVNAKRLINQVPPQSRMQFRFTINAYRGCSHACTYCFARPTHEFLGFDKGQDFERKIVVKVNAVERVRAELRSPRWRGDLIAMGTNTDPYQKAEGRYHLTRGVIEALVEAGNPFSILTKSTLILRDLDLLASAARRVPVRVNLSIGTLDRAVWRLTEPGTPPPEKRLDAVRHLSRAGVTCGVLAAPILPGLSDDPASLELLGEACAEAGAVSVTPLALHLRPGVKEHFMGWLAGSRPDLVEEYRRRFARRSYQGRTEQDRLRQAVMHGYRRAGGRPLSVAPASVPERPAASPDAQLRLL